MNNYRHSLRAPVILGMLALGLMLPTRSTAATAPRVTTLTASNVTATAATLKGTVIPGSATTTVWFEWGPGNAFKHSTTPASVSASVNPVVFSTPITGLAAGITYRCRAVASNNLGIVRGVPVSFGVPVVTLNGANPQTNAQFEPFVDPGAFATGFPSAMAVGDSYSLVLKADGHVAGWGINTEGQTTITNAATNIVAIAAGYVHALALRSNGSVFGWGTDNYDQLAISPEATNVIALAAGAFHSLALRNDGTVVCWGSDDLGQSTVPEEATNVVSIAAGYTHSLALRADGNVVEWGEFPSGPVGPPPQATNVVAIATGFSHSLALRANGTVVAWGGEAPQVVTVPGSVTNVIAIAAGYAHSFALRADGTMVGWGFNDYGEITFPSEATNVTTIGAGFGFSQALRADGSVIGWGNSDSDQTTSPTNLIANLSVTISGTVNIYASGTYPLLYSATNIFGFAGTATRTVIVPGAGAPVITSCGMLGNGSFQLDFDYVPGTNCTVIAATNLALPATNWTVLGQATENPAGHYQFTDPAATGFARRFYRLRLP